MSTRLEKLLSTSLPDKTQTYTERDVILYALGVGLGADPMDESQLRFVYEKDLLPLPTMPVVMGAMRIRDLDLGINYVKMVHGEQSLVMHKLPPVAATVVTKSKLVGVLDKGVDKGAVIVLRREVFDQANGDCLATIDMTLFARGDGGIGSSMTEQTAPVPIPDRAADVIVEVPTLPQAALIYRLSGDLNPLHAEPAFAKQAGFDRPILHGLATYGVVGYATLKSLCNNDPARLRSLKGRFSAPVFPGERIQVSLWREAGGACIRAAVPERNAVVFNNGFVELS
mgnify:CR=1 FL=1